MDTAVAQPAEYGELDSLLDAGNAAEALDLIATLMRNDPTDRLLRFYSLKARVIAFGPERFEAEIWSLCAEQGLSEAERANAMQILRQGFESATSKGDAAKAWAYQRALRRFVAGLPVDLPIASGRAIPRETIKTPTAIASADELAHLRAIFSEESGNSRANDGSRIDSSPRRPRRLLPAAGVLLVGVAISLIGIKLIALTNHNQRTRASNQAAPVVSPESPPASDPAPAALGSSESPPASDQEPAALANSNRPQAESAAPVKAQIYFNGAGDPNHAEDNAATADLLRQAAEKPTPRSLPGAPARVFKAMQAVGLRDEPRFGAPKHDALEQGAKFIMMEQDGSWLRVRHEASGSSGYVRMEFLAPATPDS